MRVRSLLLASGLFLFTSLPFAASHAETFAEPEPAAAAPAEAPAAAAPAEARAAAPKREHDVSLTFSPFHLLLPVFEVTGEYAVDDHFGVAVIAGYGSLPISTTTVYNVGGSSTTSTEHVGVWELGGHVNYYVLGNFDHGMQLGAEILWVGASVGANDSHTSVVATGLAVGPYLGYKIATHVGFTFEANLGVEYLAARANTSDGTSSAQEKKVIPLVNLNVGWSF
jgi:hypothetical protein